MDNTNFQIGVLVFLGSISLFTAIAAYALTVALLNRARPDDPLFPSVRMFGRSIRLALTFFFLVASIACAVWVVSLLASLVSALFF